MTNQGLIAFLTFFHIMKKNVRRRGFMNKKFLNRTWRSVSAALLAISFAVSLPAVAEEEPKAPSSLLMRSETDWASETELESESNSIYSDYEAFLIEQLYETNTSLTLLAGKSTWMDSDAGRRPGCFYVRICFPSLRKLMTTTPFPRKSFPKTLRFIMSPILRQHF